MIGRIEVTDDLLRLQRDELYGRLVQCRGEAASAVMPRSIGLPTTLYIEGDSHSLIEASAVANPYITTNGRPYEDPFFRRVSQRLKARQLARAQVFEDVVRLGLAFNRRSPSSIDPVLSPVRLSAHASRTSLRIVPSDDRRFPPSCIEGAPESREAAQIDWLTGKIIPALEDIIASDDSDVDDRPYRPTRRGRVTPSTPHYLDDPGIQKDMRDHLSRLTSLRTEIQQDQARFAAWTENWRRHRRNIESREARLVTERRSRRRRLDEQLRHILEQQRSAHDMKVKQENRQRERDRITARLASQQKQSLIRIAEQRRRDRINADKRRVFMESLRRPYPEEV